MTDILDEVLNESKSEYRLSFFKKSLPKIILLTIIIASSITLYGWYKNAELSRINKTSDTFVEFLNNKDSLDINLESINKTKLKELMDLKMAGDLIKSNDLDNAFSHLATIANNKDYDDITTAFAKITWINIALDKESLDNQTKDTAIQYLEYFSDIKKPFFFNATIAKALLYRKLSNNDLAKQYAELLISYNDAPNVLKEQANAILLQLIN